MTDEAAKGIRRCAVQVRGVVQGVGFRPFVYRLAMEEGLGGFIRNDTDGVTIEIEGADAQIEAFLRRLQAETPPLARIDSVSVKEAPLAPGSLGEGAGRAKFQIVSSEVKGRVSTGIPADAATCPDCLRELLDPADRRYRYPFLNCTNCGPRFTITRRIPYDRPQTSMAAFPMCAACQAEYDDPLNRRFHAQPNACWECGPQVTFRRPQTASTAQTGDCEEACGEDAVRKTVQMLVEDGIMAIKGIGGFHLSVDATNEEAVQRLRARKHRYGKPLAVMVRDLDAARAVCTLTAEEETLLTTPARPIVLARRRQNCGVAPSVSPGIPWLGVFLPYAPLHHLLFADGRLQSLVMTSANLSEEPIAIDNEEARERLRGIADAFLVHDREILQRCDDSVMAVVDGAPQIIRRARGFVPLGVALGPQLPLEAPPLLAVGGHLKNVLALARGRFVYQSQHLGDLENLTGLAFFEESLQHLMRTFEIEPRTVVHDLHPGYLSTGWARKWAEERNLPTIAVQHHHAHIAGCMAEHGLHGPVIGLALDGTGHGTDGKIWGGEVLIATLAEFKRFAHLDYVPMPGGEKAIREPWRMAFAYIRAAGIAVEEAADWAGCSLQEAQVLERMIERGINAPQTSSLGRLFDAVAAVVLKRRVVDYEAQAAIELEGIAVDGPDALDNEAYALVLSPRDLEVPPIPDGCPRSPILGPGKVTVDPVERLGLLGDSAGGEPLRISTVRMWQTLLGDLRAGVDAARIGERFHAGVAAGFVQAALRARAATGLRQVALSGGCMHNRRLTRLLRAGLEAEEFKVFLHRNVSPGDGGLSYGQAVVATARIAQQNQDFDRKKEPD